MSRVRLTVRARLTLIYTALFAVCGAISLAVSYALEAHLGLAGRGSQPSLSSLTSFVARCRSQKSSGQLAKAILAKCGVALQELGAQNERGRTL